MKRIFILLMTLSSLVVCAQKGEVFTIGTIQAYPGEIVSGKLEVEDGLDTGSYIPVSILYGVNPGPVLTLNAGMHGTEYVPVIALQEIRNTIKPESLSGILILVHVANIPSFLGKTAYGSPVDKKNPNRVFPGKSDGSFSERLAYTLANEIISKSDYYIDLHGGEFNEHLVNFLYYYYGCPDKELCGKSRLLAHAMGNRYLVPYNYSEVPDSLPSEFSEYEAIRRGVPSIAVEFGDRGEVNPSVLSSAVQGIVNVMRTIGMLEGESFVVRNPLYLMDEIYLKSHCDGLFYPLFDKGEFVTGGSLLGYITDFWGQLTEEFVAPYSGIVISIFHSPGIKSGDNVIFFARVEDSFSKE